ncbi:TrkH family potassium uptake protein [Leptothoe sp. PORK10 BA2]|uniref:TrkH family potassium uptake protein n=1 Tax=Leptothoe sp. PORK10 BA2 TaxID=3110254 RepID=UPI002B21B684|nr:TrkH family potassium uptake protein [Leptothoe sp. PORK10 BA2]MEA5462164.1 TrkH family potassium uptake protein [Leptothoe sp. PORK10 BA2]
MTVSRTVCIGFLAVITVGTLLLMLPLATASGEWTSPIVALFTATSAVCVTGLIVVDTGSYFSPLGQGIIVLLIQVGGLGYMTATTLLLLLLGRRLGLKDRLAIQQSLDTAELSSAASLIKSIIAMTMVFELSGAFLLMPRFASDYGASRSLWLSLFHSVSAFNNAGFSLFADSLVQYVHSPLVNGVIAALVILGGIGYQVIMEAFIWMRDRIHRQRKHQVFSLHFKVVTSTTLALLVLGTLAFFAVEFFNPDTLGPEPLNVKLLAAGFQSVIMRTAGFNSIDIGAMKTSSLFIAIALMFIGASPGSTGGGIKTTTIRILLNCTRTILKGENEVLAYQREIPDKRVLKAISVVVASAITVVMATIFLSLTDPGIEFIELLFETVSAFATVGVSTGITAELSTLGQIVIIATMYIGRVGILLLMSALLGDPKPSNIHYPEEDLLVG